MAWWRWWCLTIICPFGLCLASSWLGCDGGMRCAMQTKSEKKTNEFVKLKVCLGQNGNKHFLHAIVHFGKDGRQSSATMNQQTNAPTEWLTSPIWLSVEVCWRSYKRFCDCISTFLCPVCGAEKWAEAKREILINRFRYRWLTHTHTLVTSSVTHASHPTGKYMSETVSNCGQCHSATSSIQRGRCLTNRD